ncbi:MAG: YvcK family protein, partial [Actinobacteria bacterium]|nr:YvcK family protein [Actinomycetota bacterium]
VAGVEFRGLSGAKAAPEVLDSLRDADVVMVCPSNPVVSIGPILALPEVRDTLREHPRVVGVSPIIKGKPLKGPADRLMAAVGAEVSAAGVAEMYRDFIDVFVIDSLDEAEASRIEALGMELIVTDTVMTDQDASARLAKAIL